jgi:hypothetical protein
VKVFKHFYAPFLMKKWVRPLVIVLFFGWFCSSVAVMPSVEVGLDQEITMPDESFVLKYFEYLKTYLSVGPPFYVVLNSTNHKFDYSDVKLQVGWASYFLILVVLFIIERTLYNTMMGIIYKYVRWASYLQSDKAKTNLGAVCKSTSLSKLKV